MKRATCLLGSLLILLAGCRGPLGVKPMVDRLEPVIQEQVNDSWDNVFALRDGVDRDLLLDVIMYHQLFQTGVDKLHMTSHKQVRDGAIVMEIQFDREKPDEDAFVVSYVDRGGTVLRRETYTRDDIDGRVELYSRSWLHGQPVTDEPESLEQIQARLEREWLEQTRETRIAAVEAVFPRPEVPEAADEVNHEDETPLMP